MMRVISSPSSFSFTDALVAEDECRFVEPKAVLLLVRLVLSLVPLETHRFVFAILYLQKRVVKPN